ncbi:hypothetical protein RS130_01540 [Paraglaciecola aquimarina]|uniref:Uncharacterized protein n=1 Tax=Paraglaciecola aquimarina TaxID=1235557 RepID=A0ABU3SS09_9ALTE|nr:hypothetical protein [Paraglaciecola aquimarina]MDU0352780.1 hypothetical protein [Paraglaciecola aquimarina]
MCRKIIKLNNTSLFNALNLKEIDEDDIKPNNHPIKSVCGFDIKTLPLWPYILLEAELQNNNATPLSSHRGLGSLGSILVAEVIVNAIKQSKYSVFNGDTYSYDAALNKMGKFGQLLTSLPNQSSTESKLTMHNLLSLELFKATNKK